MFKMIPTSLLDWQIYENAFSTQAMRNIFNERAAIAAWVETEKAIATAQGELGLIPSAAALAINTSLSVDAIDLQQLHSDTVEVGRPIVGLVKQLSAQLDTPHAQWVHYGVTTYDVMDTGTVLQVKQATSLLQARLTFLRIEWEKLAHKFRDTAMIGRTNGQHAQPTTFGARVATWIEEMVRHQTHIHEATNDALQIQLGGMVGSLAAFESDGIKLRESIATSLGLAAPLSNWHNARDGVARLTQLYGLVCASLARIARDIVSLQSTDIGEMRELGAAGRGRSSGMPHKRNPRAGEYAEAVARLGRQRAAGIVEMMGQEHERSGGSYIAEWVLVPEVFLLVSGAVEWMIDLTGRLHVDEARMTSNINVTNGMALSERYMLYPPVLALPVYSFLWQD